jgi:hypothetical protein
MGWSLIRIDRQHIIYSAIFANFLFLLRLSALYGRTKFGQFAYLVCLTCTHLAIVYLVYILLGAVYVIEGSVSTCHLLSLSLTLLRPLICFSILDYLANASILLCR